MLALAAFFAVHASLRYFRFGALQASSSATWRSAKPQSGCLPRGSLLTNQLRQSATRHRLVAGRPTAASAVVVRWQANAQQPAAVAFATTAWRSKSAGF